MHLYQRIFEQTPDALVIVALDGRIVKVNGTTEAMFGYGHDELVGCDIELLIPKRYAPTHVAQRTGFVATPEVRRMGSRSNLFACRKDESEFPADIMISPLETDEGTFILCAVRDIGEQKAIEAELRNRNVELEQLHGQLKELASRDALTGLFNRRTFQEHCEWLLQHSVRRHESFSILLIDLDFFKRINDEFGHAEGDRVLVAVARALEAACRRNDLPARYGGEEFAVALPATDTQGSLIVGEHIRAAIAAIAGLQVSVTTSIGVVTCAPELAKQSSETTFAALVDRADSALYFAKRAGRNCVCHVERMERDASMPL